uniref:Col_cuticle_N domain-containing protein n=1 Tax=Heterorhabditis bacteriophora TaxID=37862 RepID=A0A1I7XVF0_HETBA
MFYFIYISFKCQLFVEESSSDEYKRKAYEEMEKSKEWNFYSEGFSVECYVYSLIITTLTIIGLISTLYYTSLTPYPPDLTTYYADYGRTTCDDTWPGLPRRNCSSFRCS